jgi:hypothetical protein
MPVIKVIIASQYLIFCHLDIERDRGRGEAKMANTLRAREKMMTITNMFLIGEARCCRPQKVTKNNLCFAPPPHMHFECTNMWLELLPI